jgi:hypothetical protein
LVLLNKTDLLGDKFDKDKIIKALDLGEAGESNKINFQPASLKKNEGINEGLTWLAKSMVAI